LVDMNGIRLNTIEEAIEDIKKGKLLIVVDDEDRENEGDLIMAAEKVTPESVNFMAKQGSGLICVPIHAPRLDDLQLKPMVSDNTESMRTAFTVSVDAREGITTGISAYDRAHTIKVLIDPTKTASDLRKPGHIFPLREREGGVLTRAGHTEASVDLSRLAGLYPAGVLCEIMNEDGTMARTPQLMEFAKKHHLIIITIKDLIEYRRRNEKLVTRTVESDFPSKFGLFKLYGYKAVIDNGFHVAIVKGSVAGKENVLVRVHSECLTGDVLGSLRCDCGPQLDTALQMIEEEGMGVLLYLRQEGRGIGLENKLKAYVLQDQGMDTVEANIKLGFKPDLREYGIGAQILEDLGLSTIRLMTNNTRKIVGLEGYGLTVVEQVPLQVGKNEYNKSYLQVKRDKLGHLLDR
jgi:3,4-dihydroxy 2-butanone 4-phosphate synthase/GTP cyclohydrolase II